jgi:3-phenylpropionate/trans-cinnamate dioxygenase ferredoxin subunit
LGTAGHYQQIIANTRSSISVVYLDRQCTEVVSMVKTAVCLTSELLPGSMRGVEVLGRSVLVVNVEGTFYAVDGICSHGLADLAQGKLEGHILQCPRHGARFDVRNGKVLTGPVDIEGRAWDLRTYPVVVEKGCLTVDV